MVAAKNLRSCVSLQKFLYNTGLIVKEYLKRNPIKQTKLDQERESFLKNNK